MRLRRVALTLACLFPTMTSCTNSPDHAASDDAPGRVHYLEIVCIDVAAQCTALERLHGCNFGEPNADLGMARVATLKNGMLLGVRAPLSEHEQPIVRSYHQVSDIAAALQTAAANGATVAYGPARQGDTGTWAIYFAGGAQIGLWQR